MDNIPVISEETSGLNLENNEVIGKCETLNYLGIHLIKKGTDDSEMATRMNKRRRIFMTEK